jgi:hypothetical protein
MTVRPQPREVKQIVARAFLELGAPMPSLFSLNETLFLTKGKCLARSYRAGGLKAVWHIDEGIIRFHDAQGNTLRTINLFEELVPQVMAA